jgi:tetratricopeptide (TPR) repeat protein
MVFALVLAQAVSGAWSGGRPPECFEERVHAGNVWERTKSSEVRRYCDLIASASSKLASGAGGAEAALEAAKAADGVLPGHGAPRMLLGRALAALGKFDEALVMFEESKARDAGSLDEPAALLAWSRALARKGRLDEASQHYRALLPRASSLSPADRQAAALEAGLVAMARGSVGIDDATPALREALREAPHDEQGDVAVLALALALERGGETTQGRTLLADRFRGDPRNVIASTRAKEALAVAPDEAFALAAFALEAMDAAGAADQWEAYLSAAPKGPWAAWARSRLTEVRGGTQRRRTGTGR